MTEKNFKYLAFALVALLASNLVLGMLSFGFIRQLDERYGQLLDNSLPLLNQVRALSWETTQVQRSINRYPQFDAEKRVELLARRAAAGARAGELLELIRNRQLPASIRPVFQEVERAQRELMQGSTLWYDAIGRGDLAGAQAINLTTVQPAYEQHAKVLEQMATLIEKHGIELNETYSAEASRSRSIVLAIGTWPLFAGFAALAVTGVGIYLLMPLVRRFERELRR